ncbi:MAG: hypothetical protein KC502_09825, partial [Myxococcales bacterium]|nr:hypothetical protein [Myxococcales bacterium]
WPTNHRPTETWPKVERAMHVLTGHYGLAMNEATGALERLGWLDDALDVEAALKRSNAVIAGFPTAKLSFEGGAGTGSAVATSFLGTKGATVDRAQMLDGGRIMNRLQFETVGFASNSKLKGRVTLAAMPRHFTLTQTLTGHAAAKVARIRIGGAALAALPKSEWLVPGRVLRRTNGAGKGWVFLVADVPGQSLATNVSGEVVAQRSVSQLAKAGTTVALTVLAAQAVSAAELSMFMTPNKAVQVSYQLLNLAGKPVGAPVVAPWNAELGAYKVPLGTLKSAGAPGKPNWEQAVYHNWYGRHRLTVTRVSKAPMAVPLALFGSGGLSWYITGGAPLWRDSKGRPTGTPIQVSKNWHGQVWYHLYSQPTFRGPGADTLELTMASSRWGPVFAASHAQLSLVGWSQAGGHWDESALGCFGESITYDPDVTLNRAMVDDVRPFQVLSKTKWSWTGNVGGADFLRYATTAKPYWERRLGRVRSHYAAPGPNLTDVVYAGVSSDGAIRATIRTQLVGTDDVVRAYYHLDYEFLKDVDYSRLAFFQVAADNYADNLFAKYAYGNASGAIKVAQSTNHKSKGYASNAHRGIALPGKSPWVLLYNNQRTGDSLPERFANVGFVVRSFEAKIGQATLTTPHINLTRTYNGKMSQMAFQLGLPHTPGSTWCGAPCLGKQRFVPKGSRVRATVEYLVLPANKSRYYGESAWLKALAPSLFDHPEQIRQVAANNQLVVQATVGKVLRAQPVVVDAEATQAKMGMIGPGAVVADLTMSGGLGFVPVTIAGLPRHGGWRLQRLLNGTWVTYDPAVHGNDHWQAEFTALSQDWRLTFSLPGVTKQRVRLVSE